MSYVYYINTFFSYHVLSFFSDAEAPMVVLPPEDDHGQINANDLLDGEPPMDPDTPPRDPEDPIIDVYPEDPIIDV